MSKHAPLMAHEEAGLGEAAAHKRLLLDLAGSWLPRWTNLAFVRTNLQFLEIHGGAKGP